MKAALIVCLSAIVILSAVCESSAQSQLSYTNADIAEKLIRSATTTTPVPTTKKSTFFGGIRNLFSRNGGTSTTSDVPPPVTTPLPPVAAAIGKSGVVAGAVAVGAVTAPTTAKPTAAVVAGPPVTVTTSTTTTSTTTTTTTTPRPTTPSITPIGQKLPTALPTGLPTGLPKDPLHDFQSYATITLTTKKPKTREDFPALPAPRQPAPVAPKIKEDFPALPAPRQPAAVPPTAAPIATTANAWGRPLVAAAQPTPAPGGVSFVTPARTPAAGASGGVVAPTATTKPATEAANEATDAELEALTEVLYTKETSLLPLVTINYQGRTQSSAIVDEAPLPLITVNEEALNANPTVAKMRLLYNNYEQDTAVNEHVSAMERVEESDFVDSLLAGPMMRHTMNYLQQKGKVTLDPKTHRDLLKTIWFSLYSRSRGKIGSSAFEHVFLTELRNGTVSGFHNWIYYHAEEKAGRANYQGWLKRTELGTKAAIVKYRFSYNGIMKPVNAMFVGTSPELEVALYTLCFAMRPDLVCPVSLGGQRLNIRTHTFRYRSKNLIGSAFPEI